MNNSSKLRRIKEYEEIIALSTIVLISPTNIAFSKELNNYVDILNTVKDGKNITTFINFSNCKPEIKVYGQLSPKSITHLTQKL